jgi:DNA-binding NarL/FixJ family response regulator
MEACYALGAFYYVNKLVIIDSPDLISIALANRMQQDALVSRFRTNETKIILDSLGNREIEALKLKEQGFKNEQIADKMNIEHDSARRILTRTYGKIKKHPIGKFIRKFFT